MTNLQLGPELELDPWQDTFRVTGRVRIPNFLAPESALALYECLRDQKEWNLVFNEAGQHRDIGADSESLWTDVQRESFLRSVHGQATEGFQYLYRSIPVYDIFHRNLLPGHLLTELFAFLNGDDFLAYVKRALDMPDIGFADAQATAYSAGHFLTAHDDNVEGKHRLAAYVLSLTPHWKTDWGGILQFPGEAGTIKEAFSPTFNALTLFKIRQPHSVTYVTPFAGAPRFSVTGWLRAGVDPGA